MAVKTAQRHTDGELEERAPFFSELAGEVGDKGTLLVFRITELLDPERGDYSWHGPLTGDVLVVESDVNPKWDGRVFRDITVKFAPTWVLRGQARPDSEVRRARDIPDGDNVVGDDVITRIRMIKRKAEFIAADEPSAAEEKAALRAIKAAGGDDWPSRKDSAPAADTVLGRAEQRQKAAKDDDDSEPPF